MQDNKPDTKKLIFDTALRLFAASGVENVSMRDLADEVGIKAASIYNHYPSKDELVEACYNFFLENHDIGRLSKEQYTRVLVEGSKEDVLNIPNDRFPDELAENILNSMIVLFSRIYTDTTAINKYTQMIDRSILFMMEFLDQGIQLGRFEKFDVRGISMLFLSARLFSAQSTTIHSDVLNDWDMAQREMFTALMGVLPFSY